MVVARKLDCLVGASIGHGYLSVAETKVAAKVDTKRSRIYDAGGIANDAVINVQHAVARGMALGSNVNGCSEIDLVFSWLRYSTSNEVKHLKVRDIYHTK